MRSLVAALLLASPGYVRPAVPQNCAAIRGNGELVMSHFSSLARFVEDQGVIDGLAGGTVTPSRPTSAVRETDYTAALHRSGGPP